jgi:hypothetical protein
MIDTLSPYERTMKFLKLEADPATRLKTLLFIRGELNHVIETNEIKYLKEFITGIIDVLTPD